MRILVYGAGVQGSELAHRLLQNEKNVVTLLTRGERKDAIDEKGLIIRHWAQRKTTVDRVPTIDHLAPEDFYDVIFVAVQAQQVADVLPALKANRSARRIRSLSVSRTMRAAARAGRSSASMPGSASPSAEPRPPFPACSASGCRLLLTA